MTTKKYFLLSTIFLLVLSLVAFSDNLIFDVGQESNSDPKFIVHGLFFLAWFTILVLQARYISRGDIKTHRRVGKIGMLVGLGVILSTAYVFFAVYEGWQVMAPHVKANRIFTAFFALCIILAYRNRNQAVLHKRFLYVGTLFVLGPILDRVAGKVMDVDTLLPFVIFEMVVWNILFVSFFVYDWLTLRRIHTITWSGVLVFYIVWGLAFFVL